MPGLFVGISVALVGVWGVWQFFKGKA